MNGRVAAGKENWLLIKERDEAARPGQGTKLVAERPESVTTGRTIEMMIGDGLKRRVSKPWVKVVEAARAAQRILDDLGLRSFLKTTVDKRSPLK